MNNTATEEKNKDSLNLSLNEYDKEKEKENKNENEDLDKNKDKIQKSQNSNTKSLFQYKKRRSLNKINLRPANEVNIVLDIYTKIIRKEDSDTCICHNFLDIDLDEIKEKHLKSKELIESNFLKEKNETTKENNNNENNNNNDNNKINKEYKGYFYEREIISSMSLPYYGSGRIKVFDVIKKLKAYGYPLTGSMISIYSKIANDYIFIGADPIDKNFYLNSKEYDTKMLKIRVLVYLEDKIIPDINFESNNLISVSRKNSVLDKGRLKRTKERKIGYIIEKVNSWRKLYNGFRDSNNKYTKYSLEEAAKIIGISKKSLDDYLLQLRLGRKFGFDFNSKRNERVGLLRTFVKMSRQNLNKNDL